MTRDASRLVSRVAPTEPCQARPWMALEWGFGSIHMSIFGIAPWMVFFPSRANPRMDGPFIEFIQLHSFLTVGGWPPPFWWGEAGKGGRWGHSPMVGGEGGGEEWSSSFCHALTGCP